MIELRQLEQFVAVAEELNFRRAALRLHMSQPPLSNAIKRLEDSLGKSLFDRGRRHVRLTAVGELFLRESRRTLGQAAHAVHLARHASDAKSGSIRLSFVASAALGPLPELVRRFRSGHPGVEVLLDSDTTGGQLESLRRGGTDVALIVAPLQDARGLAVHPLRDENILIALPAGHALAARRSIQLGQVARERFVSFPFAAGPGFESVFLAACQRAGFVPDIVQEVSQMLTKITLVACNVGVALVPASFAAVAMPGVAYVALHEGRKPLRYTLAFATQARHDNPLVDAFIAEARSALGGSD
ncbi:MAG: LysR family transcriptional regulator [Burkholderiales bacterium]|nr:LysR family transcriptional regulator [Burkholderiales bacterium]